MEVRVLSAALMSVEKYIQAYEEITDWIALPLCQYRRSVSRGNKDPIRCRPTDENLLKALRRCMRRSIVQNEIELIDPISKQERDDGFNYSL